MQGMDAQLAATAGYWHANTVRLQVEQDKLVGAQGNAYSAAYMTDVKSVVSYARSLGLTVVINDQTEGAPGYTANEGLPTHATDVFWSKIAAVYGNRPHIVFDLFNEPRGTGWGPWHTAMQAALTYLRSTGARNLVWVEGIHCASTLAGVPLLHGGALAYTFHHPAGAQNPADWHKAFGYLASKGYTIVDGEWAGSNMPPKGYLSYLSAHHIGLTSWTLANGSLNTAGYDTASPAGQVLRSWW